MLVGGVLNARLVKSMGKGDCPRNRDGRGSFAGKSHCGSRMSSGSSPSFLQHILFRHFMLFVKALSIFFSAQEQSLYVPRSLSEISDRDEGVLL